MPEWNWRKLTDQKIENDIGEMFRRHNVVEFKSPEDELSIDVFYKAQAYAGLYKASGERVNEIPADEVTVSLFRDVYPREMIEQLKMLGFTVAERHPGIYQIDGKLAFPTQLVVTSQLSGEQHAILRILSNNAKRKDVETFIRASRSYEDSGDRARIDSILQVSASANKALYNGIYGEGSEMCEALMEIMKKDIDKKVAEGRAEGREAGKDEANINNIRKIMKKMKFSSQKAMDFMEISAADQERYAPLLREQSDMKMPDEN